MECGVDVKLSLKPEEYQIERIVTLRVSCTAKSSLSIPCSLALYKIGFGASSTRQKHINIIVPIQSCLFVRQCSC